MSSSIWFLATTKVDFWAWIWLRDTVDWSRKWLLDVNVRKTQLVSFHRSKTVSNKIGDLICSMKIPSPKVTLYLDKSTIRLWREYFCHAWASTPVCYLDMLDKLQKQVRRTVGTLLATSFEPLNHLRNLASLNLIYRYYFGRCTTQLVKLFHYSLLFFITGSLFIIQTSLFPWEVHSLFWEIVFLDVIRVSMSTVSFFAQLNCDILYLQNAFHWHVI